MTRPGIIAATVAEAGTLTKMAISDGGFVELPEGVMVFLSGIGARRARHAAQILLENGATALISWGFAGGLVPGVASGSLIVPKRIIARDHSVYQVDPVWHEVLCHTLKVPAGLNREALAESSSVLACRSEKWALCKQTGASAVDMESASIALVAKEAGVSFIVVRAVLDTLDMLIPSSALHAIDAFGRVSHARLLAWLIRHPEELIDLIRLGRAFHAASVALTNVFSGAGNNIFCA